MVVVVKECNGSRAKVPSKISKSIKRPSYTPKRDVLDVQVVYHRKSYKRPSYTAKRYIWDGSATISSAHHTFPQRIFGTLTQNPKVIQALVIHSQNGHFRCSAL